MLAVSVDEILSLRDGLPQLGAAMLACTRAPRRTAAPVAFSIERLEPSVIKALWTDLEPRADITYFLSWTWIGTWIEQAGPPDLVLVGRADGMVICLGLLRKSVQWRHGIIRSRVISLHQTGDATQDVIQIEYNGLLCDRGFQDIGAEALAFIKASRSVGRFDELQLGGVGEAQYEEARRLGRPVHVLSLKGTASVDLRSIRESGGDYLATLSGNTRYQIKRAIKLYEARGPLSIQPARTISEALDFFDEMGRLHEAAWQQRDSTGGAWQFPFLVAFHRRLIEKDFEGGGVDIVKISCGDRPIGYIHCLVRDGWIGSYLSGFAYEDDNKIKPGLVSFCLYIQHKLETGGDLLDFLAGDHRYKTNLGRPGPSLYWFRIQEPRPQLLLERGLRSAKRAIQALRKRPARTSNASLSTGH